MYVLTPSELRVTLVNVSCLGVWLTKRHLEKGLHVAQAPVVGTSVETSSVGGENAPHSDYLQTGRNYSVYQQELQCLSTLEIQTTRFSHCSFAAFSSMCEL